MVVFTFLRGIVLFFYKVHKRALDIHPEKTWWHNWSALDIYRGLIVTLAVLIINIGVTHLMFALIHENFRKSSIKHILQNIVVCSIMGFWLWVAFLGIGKLTYAYFCIFVSFFTVSWFLFYKKYTLCEIHKCFYRMYKVYHQYVERYYIDIALAILLLIGVILNIKEIYYIFMFY
jgi:hypothetical protein